MGSPIICQTTASSSSDGFHFCDLYSLRYWLELIGIFFQWLALFLLRQIRRRVIERCDDYRFAFAMSHDFFFDTDFYATWLVQNYAAGRPIRIPTKFLQVFAQLPDDLLGEVFNKLPAKQIPSLGRVCHRWHSIVHDRHSLIPMVIVPVPMTFICKSSRLSSIYTTGKISDVDFVSSITKKKYYKTNYATSALLHYHMEETHVKIVDKCENVNEIVQNLRTNQLYFHFYRNFDPAYASQISRTFVNAMCNRKIANISLIFHSEDDDISSNNPAQPSRMFYVDSENLRQRERSIQITADDDIICQTMKDAFCQRVQSQLDQCNDEFIVQKN